MLRRESKSLLNPKSLKTERIYMYHVIYDGNCNLCVNLVKVLEQLDRGERFLYAPMQDQQMLDRYGITPQDCELGMLLIQAEDPTQRWQGSDAAEEIGRLLPAGQPFVAAYRAMPGAKWLGDRFYEQIRDNRYSLFGKRESLYEPTYPACDRGNCS
jgi:predicted DCC family thiol-disulfide oxidoreductase YuxK